MFIKKDCDEYLIFSERNSIALELYDDDVNSHDATPWVDNNYNNYNINNASYEDGANDKEDGETYEDGAGAKSTHEDVSRYSPTPDIDDPPVNYGQETMYNNDLDNTLVMGASEDN